MFAISGHNLPMSFEQHSTAAQPGRKRKLDDKAHAAAAEHFAEKCESDEKIAADQRNKFEELMWQCEVCLEKHLFPQFADAALKACEINNKKILTLYYAAAACSYLGEHEKAVNILRKLHITENENPLTKILSNHLFIGRYDKAEALINDFKQAYPGNLLPCIKAAYIEILAGRDLHQDVIAESTKFLNSFPKNGKMRFLRVNAYLAMGRIAEAEEDIKHCIIFKDAYIYLAKIHLGKHKSDEALSLLQKYIDAFSSEIGKMSHSQLKLYFEAVFYRGNIFYELNAYASAKADYQTYLEKADCSGAMRDKILYQLACCKCKENEFASALEDLKKIQAQDEATISLKGKIYLTLSNFDGALKEYIELEKVNPIKGLLGQATALMKLGQYAPAIERLNKILSKKKPDENTSTKGKENYSEVLKMRAEAFFNIKDYSNALIDFNELIRNGTQDIQIAYSFAKSVFYSGNQEKIQTAILQLRWLLSKDKDYDEGGAQLLIAGIYLRKQRVKEAEAAFAQVTSQKHAELRALIQANFDSLRAPQPPPALPQAAASKAPQPQPSLPQAAAEQMAPQSHPALPQAAAEQMAPQSHPAPTQAPQAAAFYEQMAKAAAASQAGKNASAIGIYDKLIKEARDQNAEIYFKARYDAALVWIGEKCYTKALTDIAGILKEKPDFGEALAVRAALHFIKGNATEGRKDIAAVFKIKPSLLDIAISILEKSVCKEEELATIKQYESGLRFIEVFKRSSDK